MPEPLTTTVGLKVGATVSLSSVGLSTVIYNDPNFLTAIYLGLLTGGAVFFFEYANLDAETKDSTSKAQVISSLIVVLLTVTSLVGAFMYGAEVYIKTTDLDVPKMAYVFPAVLIGLSKKEVVGLLHVALDVLKKYIIKRGNDE